MQQFFKTLKEVAALNPKEYSSIKELVIDIAKSGNYRREKVILKNGKTVLRTKYGELDPKTGVRKSTFDSSLVAKWFLFYKNSFMARLIRHPELREYYMDIFHKTFTIYFQSLNIEKISCDAAVTFAVEKTFHNRLTYHIRLLGSEKREQRMRNAEAVKRGLINKEDLPEEEIARKRIETYSTMVRRNTLSLDQIMESEVNSNANLKSLEDSTSNISESNLILIELSKRLDKVPYGERLLEVLLNTNGKVVTSNIGAYMEFSPEERNDKEVIEKLKNAYRIIKSTLIEFNSQAKEYYMAMPAKKRNLVKIKFSENCVF